MPEMTFIERRKEASRIWAAAKRGHRPSSEERALMVSAYWQGSLPLERSPDRFGLDNSCAQWVEDNFPWIIG